MGKNSFLVATLLFCHGGAWPDLGLSQKEEISQAVSSMVNFCCPELASFSNITVFCICRGCQHEGSHSFMLKIFPIAVQITMCFHLL